MGGVLDRVSDAIQRAGTAEEARAFGAAAVYVEHLESVAAAAAGLVRAAPRVLARDAGQAGEAWDLLVARLEGVDNDYLADAVECHAVRGTVRSDSASPLRAPAVEVGSLLSAAAELQRQLDRLGDEAVQAAWVRFLERLSEAWA